MKFTDLKLTERSVKSINNFGYMDATEVQMKAIPEIIEGHNLIVRSQTGTGKTAAFGIGLMERIVAGTSGKALILVPTRELAVQVCKELRGLCQLQQLKVYAVYGGQPIGLQIKDISKRYEILVATPGRLLDLYRRGKVDLSSFNAIVLDEADHMLDLGFTKEVTSILKQLPVQKLVLLFSATVDEGIQRIISRYIPESKLIEVGEMKIVSSIKEEKIEVPHREKSSKLLELLESHKNMKTLIFLRTKRSVINLKYQLTKLGIERVGMLQGDMPQAKRIRVLNRFKENDLSVLVATNVAARGLHIDDVGLIINYDRAENKETHLHRVGRTGRMGQNGKVINFISNDGPSFGRGGNRRSGRNSERRSDRNRGARPDRSGNRNKRPNGRTGRPSNRNRSQGKRNAGPGDKNPRRLPENNFDSRHSGARSHSPRRGKKSGGQSKRGSRPGDKSPRRSRKPARFRFSKSRRNR